MGIEVIVRPATMDDRDAIVALVRMAFTRGGDDGQSVVDIVKATWVETAQADGFELVAGALGAVVGHVLAAPGTLAGRPVLGVAPLAVAPSRQGEGIGTALMRELLRLMDAAGTPLAVILGEPAYYGRFGFEPSGPMGIWYRPAGSDNPHFMVRRFSGHDPSLAGEYVYCWESPPA